MVTRTRLGVNFIRKLAVFFPLSSIPVFVSVLRQDISFNMVTRLHPERPRDRGLIPGMATNFHLLQIFQTSSEGSSVMIARFRA